MYVAKKFAIGTRPAAMKPWSHHQLVINPRIHPLDGFVGVESAVKIFGVKPTSDGHHCGLDVLQVRQRVTSSPKIVVIRMDHHLIPKSYLTLEVILICVCQRSHL